MQRLHFEYTCGATPLIWRNVVMERSSAEFEPRTWQASVRQARSRVLRRLREELGDVMD